MERILEVSRTPEGEIVIRLCAPGACSGEVRQHMRTAAKEGLLALRSLVDASLQRLEEREKRGQSQGGPTKIDVQ